VTFREGEERDPTSVDELRQQLRSLGYLEAGVDRFVLAPAHNTRGAAAIALAASLRIGALGGMLLGPAAALGILLQLPDLVTSLRNAALVAVYIALLFGAATAAAALLCGVILSLAARVAGPGLARHGRPLSTAAGVTVGAASLASLTLLLIAVRTAGTNTPSMVSMAGGLAAAVAISLLLGHAVMLTALALTVAATGRPIHTRGVPVASWRAMAGAGAVAFAATLIFVTVHDRGARAADNTGSGPLTAVPSGLRIRLLAVDGVDPSLFASLAGRGRLPALSNAFDGAGAQLTLAADRANPSGRLDPAQLWTTVATGQPPAVHGVQTLETRRVAGLQGTVQSDSPSTAARIIGASTDLLRLTRPSVVTGNERREKTFWEVAGDAGLRTTVVNWWATWPASSRNGLVLSDRTMLRLERGGTLDAEISPAPIYERLAPKWPALRGRASDLVGRALAGVTDSTVLPLLRRSAEIDAAALLLTEEVADTSTDLIVTYLPGLDIAQDALLGERSVALASASGASARVLALESYYVVLDTLLADTARARDGELVMMVTAPGRVAPGPGGRLMLNGAPVRTGMEVPARLTDVAPTLLYALGVPISGTLAGSPLVELFTESFTASHPVAHVPTYGPPLNERAPRTGQALDEEMVDRLRSLGYLR
jgi:hypothetical protein